jgi:hypothetical protein
MEKLNQTFVIEKAATALLKMNVEVAANRNLIAATLRKDLETMYPSKSGDSWNCLVGHGKSPSEFSFSYEIIADPLSHLQFRVALSGKSPPADIVVYKLVEATFSINLQTTVLTLLLITSYII